ncbi:MAG: hypothetical protein U5O16_23205, partial [Rhodococcus sp. (in: high G+C Gram-positive bacteria)]|nr:hypothetical protein [Rhodococcus sp. (in: high G+C Gram-positive bacteria)]
MNTADHLYRTCLANLFDGHLDALTVMKLKDIADELEDAADARKGLACDRNHRPQGIVTSRADAAPGHSTPAMAFTFTNGFHDSANAI